MKLRYRFALPTAGAFVAALTVLAFSTRGAGSSPAPDSGDATALPPPSNGAISPQDQADALHLVIATDRALYCREFVAHQADGQSSLNCAAGTKPGASWPSPSEMFRRAAESIQSQGAEFSFALRSLHPIDPRDGPQTELEQQGLAFVVSHPTQNYYGHEMLGGRRYFTAIYPDDLGVAASVGRLGHGSVGHAAPVGESWVGIVVRVPLEF